MGIKLEIKNKKISGKIPKHLKTNNIFPNKPSIKEEIKREIKLF